MAEQTTNHGFNLYEIGDEKWTHRGDFELLEKLVPAQDSAANRSEYTPYDGTLFHATDTDVWYRGNGTDWDKLGKFVDPDDFASNDHDNDAHNLTFVADGDGVDRRIWVSKDGTIPEAAEDHDIVFTEASD